MTTLTETNRAGDFIISLAHGNRSKEEVTLVSGQDLAAGTVLGKITTGGKYKQVDQDAVDGSQTAVAILLAAGDASGGDIQVAVVARDAEVNGEQLIWPDISPDFEEETGIVELAAVGIIVRQPTGTTA